MLRALRKTLAVLGWILVGIGCLLVSIAIHVQTSLALHVARPMVESLVSGAIRGSLEIGHLDEVSSSDLHARDVVIRDAQGREVIRAAELIIWPDFRELFTQGRLHVEGAHINHGVVTLYVIGEAQDEVSLVDAFQGSGPPSPPGARASPIPVVLDGLRLHDIDVQGDVPEFPGLRIEDVEAYGQIEIDRSVILRVREGTGRMTGPYPGETVIDRVVIDMDTDWEQGLGAYAEAHRGTDRVRARIFMNRPGFARDPNATAHMGLDVHIEELHASTLADMGIEGTAQLAGTVRGDLRLIGPVDDLVLESYLTHESGPIAVRGRIPREGALVVELETYDFDIDALIPAAPPIAVGGTIRFEALRDPDQPQRTAFAVRALPLVVTGIAVPAFSAEGVILEDAVVIERVEAPHLGGVVEGHGRVGFDGSLDVHARIDVDDIGGDPNVQRMARGTHGAVEGTLDVTAGEGGTNLVLDANLAVARLRSGPLRASRLAVRGRARGDLARPVVHAEVRGDGVVVSGQDLGTIDARIDGGPSEYQVGWRSQGGVVRSLVADATATRRRGAWIVEAPRLEVDLGTGVLRGSMRRIRVLPNEIRIGELALEGDGQRIAADARFRTRGGGPSHARIDISGIDLQRIGAVIGADFSSLRGQADGQLVLEGNLRDPDARLHGTIRGLSFDRVRNADIEYDLAYHDGTLTTRVHGDFGPRGDLDVEGPIEVPFAALTDPARFAREARFGLHVYANHLNLAFILPLLGEDVQRLGITGRIGGDVRIDGSLDDMRIDPAIVTLDMLALPGWSELRIKTQVALADDRLRIDRVWIADHGGELAMLEGELGLSLEAPPTDLPSFLRALGDAPWRVAARITPRRAETWPRPLSRMAPLGVIAGATIVAAGGDGDPVRMDLEGSAEWVDAPSTAPCALGLRPHLRVAGVTRDGVTAIELTGATQGTDVATVRAEAATPIDDWLRTGVVTATEPDLLVRVTDLPLEHVPWTCTRAAGLVTAEILLEDVLGNAPSIEGSVRMRELRIVSEEEPGLRGTHPYEMRAALRVRSAIETHLEGCAIIAAQGQLSTPLSECGSPTLLPQDSEVVVSAAVPIRWVPGTPIPELLLDRAIDVAMLMSEAHLEPLLALVPQITEADVIADGRVLAHGPWDALETTGGFAMRDGRVRIVGLGQQLTDIGGAVQLHGTRIVIGRDDAIHARDGDGTIDLWGEIGMRGLLPTSANVTMAPDEFPVRRESAVLATLSGRAEAGITIGVDGVEGAIHVERLTVRLPEQAAGSVQPLDPHPEVALVGSDAPELALEDGPGYPIHLRVDAHTPFWVRRNDFAVQGTAELDVTYLDPNLYVGGYATLGRGYFEVFGKRFLVQRGSLVFTGDTELNPLVDLVATYELPGRAGATISVIASGRLLDDLQIEFTSTETSDQGEIIALLVSGRRSIGAGDPQASQQAATEQAASFLAGISAGILTLGLRQQFGDIVPMIAIEAGSNLGETRTRAGFNVDALIPDFLRGVVLGAYLEGFVTTGSGQQAGGGGGGVGGGVALELQFPEDVIGSGTYVPPMSFGIDFLWEPSQSRCETADDGTTTCTR